MATDIISIFRQDLDTNSADVSTITIYRREKKYATNDYVHRRIIDGTITFNKMRIISLRRVFEVVCVLNACKRIKESYYR